MDKIDLTAIKKARDKFESFRANMVASNQLDAEQKKAGAAQAFEYCYELAWKIMKKIMQGRGLLVGSPKDTFRKAVDEGLIDDPELWFSFQDKRNLTAHTYDEDNLELIIESFGAFSTELAKLIANLDKTS